jgi:hypothetical protein
VKVPESLTRWRVASTPTLLKFAGALLLAAVAVLSGDERERLLLAGVGAVALGVYGLRDIVAPVRLSADAEGVTVVSGFVRRRRVPWREIERVGLGEHRSLGLRSEILEIDAGESLHLFSRYDLDAPCAEVAETLQEMREAALASADEEHPDPEAEEEQRRREREHALDPAATEQRANGVDHEGDRGEPQQSAGDDDQ